MYFCIKKIYLQVKKTYIYKLKACTKTWERFILKKSLLFTVLIHLVSYLDIHKRFQFPCPAL